VPKADRDWLRTVRLVVEAVSASDVADFELAQPEFRLRLKRRIGARFGEAPARPEAEQPSGLPVPAPFTGIFYRAATPTAEPFAREGDWVEADATIGLIETMKVFNEVKTDQPGRLERLLVQNGQLVHAGETLAIISPGQRPDDAP
jgi:multidrug efflux pump subunit AcrA (membrane-fusion protein)